MKQISATEESGRCDTGVIGSTQSSRPKNLRDEAVMKVESANSGEIDKMDRFDSIMDRIGEIRGIKGIGKYQLV